MTAIDDAAAVDVTDGPDALRRVLAGDPFNRSERLATFLRFVVDETAAGRGHLLKERQIAMGALGCPSSFDPRFDPRVRVLAGRVRKALDRYYETAGALDPLRIEMPRGGYRIVLVNQQAPRRAAAARLASDGGGPAVVVVNLMDLDPGGQRRHMGAGLTESLVTTMSAYPGCRVIGPVSQSDGGGVEQARALGASMGATHVLQGSIRSGPSLVRVAVRLTDAATGEILWSQVFDESVDGPTLFEVEDRIARKVSGIVADFRGVIHQHQVGPRSGPGDHSAYDAMLRYYAYLGNLDASQVEPTTEALERALEGSPDNPLLMAMLAGMVLFSGVGQLGQASTGVVSELRVQQAVALARGSIAIDPANPHALTVMAIVELLQGRPDRCRDELDRVVAMRPTNPSLLFMAGVGAAMGGDWPGGMERIRESMELNELHPGWQHGFLALDELLRGDTARAVAEAQLVDTPGLVWGPLLRAATLAADGQVAEAAIELAQTPSALPDDLPDRHDLFAQHMRLPDDVVGCLLDALSKIPPTATG